MGKMVNGATTMVDDNSGFVFSVHISLSFSKFGGVFSGFIVCTKKSVKFGALFFDGTKKFGFYSSDITYFGVSFKH